jgi:superfamily I DNA and/or RNA helicase
MEQIQKKILTMELLDNFDMNKNDIEFTILFIVHRDEITTFSVEVINYLIKEYPDDIEKIMTSLPDYLVDVKKNLYLYGRGAAFRPNIKTIKFFLSKMKNDLDFCKFIIERELYHKNAADHGLPA